MARAANISCTWETKETVTLPVNCGLDYKFKTLTNRYEMNVFYQLSMHKGNRKPYFSITADIYENGCEYMAGCCHEEILKHFPDLKILVDLRLCDDDGMPSHEAANARYFLEQSLRNEYGTKVRTRYQRDYEKHKDAEYYFKVFCDEMRMAPIEGEYVRLKMEKLWSEPSRLVQLCGKAADSITIDLFKMAFARLVEEMRPRWKEQAEFAIRKFDLKVVHS